MSIGLKQEKEREKIKGWDENGIMYLKVMGHS